MYAKKLNWRNLWIIKADYIWKYYLAIKGKYEIVDESIDYFIALMEAAIYYLKDYDYIFYRKDIRERDFAEYLKYLFRENRTNDVYKLLENNNYNYELVVARLLFPSYYLFCLEKFINNGDNELFSVVNRVDEYENYIRDIVSKINENRVKKIVLPI